MQKRTPDIFLLVFIANFLHKIEGRKRFQKTVFLLKHFYKVSFQYDFMPYLYGPYCPELQNHIDLLVNQDILKAERHNSLFTYEITSLGQKITKYSENKMDHEEKQTIIKALEELRSENTETLVKRSKKLMRSIVE